MLDDAENLSGNVDEILFGKLRDGGAATVDHAADGGYSYAITSRE